MGIVASLGTGVDEVTGALREARSGIRFSDEYAERGLGSRVYGPVPDPDAREILGRRLARYAGQSGVLAYQAMDEAVADAGLTPEEVADERTALVVGSGIGCMESALAAWDTYRDNGRVSPFALPRVMASSVSALLATAFGMRGPSHAVSAACATSAHAIGQGALAIRAGMADVAVCGGAEDVHWSTHVLFDAMQALSTRFNDEPERASRPYDADRDGFVVSGGAAVLVLEDAERARARGAHVHGELVGYGATSDGSDMVLPSGAGAERCMRLALAGVEGRVDYVNAHATSTPAGDAAEIEAIAAVFDGDGPAVSSTKALTGHGLGAAGAQEAVYCLLMMRDRFICPAVNLEHPSPEPGSVHLPRTRIDDADLEVVMSNSFGFGGTNASLVFRRDV
ncbi:MAG: beta-ketoacyl-ACP synthase I [Thermoleophilia bacterium]|jgi:3-oxoacyl-[acyl-carrier-protein] synthase-1|nr:beta-ketoacyl-ACP synthase I [Thermoleophilia bacterium]